MKIPNFFTTTAIITGLLLFTSQAYSRPAFTQEELTKARKAASTAKHPIDFDKLMDEADRLGIECEGDLTKWVWINICNIQVDTAQSEERSEQSRVRIEESKKRQGQIDRETIRLINEAADIAEKKLNKID